LRTRIGRPYDMSNKYFLANGFDELINKGDVWMQNKGYRVIKDELIDLLKKYFTDKITSSFTISKQTDTPYTMFSMRLKCTIIIM
jgi:hypothetical protein